MNCPLGYWRNQEELKKLLTTDQLFLPRRSKTDWDKGGPYRGVLQSWERALQRSMHWYSQPWFTRIQVSSVNSMFMWTGLGQFSLSLRWFPIWIWKPAYQWLGTVLPNHGGFYRFTTCLCKSKSPSCESSGIMMMKRQAAAQFLLVVLWFCQSII